MHLAVTVAHTANAAVDKGDLVAASLRLQQVRPAEQLRGSPREAVAHRLATACLNLAEGLVRIVAVQAPVGLSEALLALGASHQVAAAERTAHVVGLRIYLYSSVPPVAGRDRVLGSGGWI